MNFVAHLPVVAALTNRSRDGQAQTEKRRMAEGPTMVSFGIYKPHDGYHIEDAVEHIVRVAATLERTNGINVAILKSLHGSWAAVLATRKAVGSNVDSRSAMNLPEAAAFTKGLTSVVTIEESGWFQLSCQETKQGLPFAELALGDIVGVRRIYSDWKRQEVLSYCSLAILKAYFAKLKGMSSYTFYKALDGKQILGLAVWDDLKSASAIHRPVGNYPHANSVEVYWKGLGAKSLKYDLTHVVYVTYQPPDDGNCQKSRAGIRI